VASVRRRVSLLDEVLGVTLWGGGIFLVLSLCSLALTESESGGMPRPAANWGGILGYQVASALTRASGSGALLLALLLCQAGLLWVMHAPRVQHGL